MQKLPTCSLEAYPNYSSKTCLKLLKQWTTLQRKNEQFKLLGPNNCCKISFINILRVTLEDNPIGLPLFLDQDSEEEHLEISNPSTKDKEDSNLPTAPIITKGITIKETKPDSTQEEETILNTIQQMPLEA